MELRYKIKNILNDKIRKHIAKKLSMGKNYSKIFDVPSEGKIFTNLKYQFQKSHQKNFQSEEIRKKIADAFAEASLREQFISSRIRGKGESNLKPKNILFLMPRSLPGASPTPNPQLVNLQIAANKLEIPFNCLFLEDLVAKNFNELEKLETELLRNINDSKIDFIFFDMTYRQRFDNVLGIPVVSPKFMKKIKSEINVLTCAVLIDLYAEQDIEMLREWDESIDFLLHSEPIALKKSKLNFTGREIFLPYTGYVNFPKYMGKKELSLNFSGGLDNGNRQRWLNFTIDVCKKMRIQPKFNVFTRNYSKYNLAQSVYMGNLQKASMALNLSQKTDSHWVLTARTFEIIALGTLLIHEEKHSESALSLLYEPYLHYLPFERSEELEGILQLLKNEPELISKISLRAQEFHNNTYTPSKLFSTILIRKLESSKLNEV